MNATRFDTLFSIRYAIRVLERYARLWHRLDLLFRILAIFSGSAAFAALMGEYKVLGTATGALFAFIVAIEYALNPQRREQEALKARSPYADLYSRQQRLGDADLEEAYQIAVKEDPVIVPESLKRLAYNDVTDERGCDPAARFELSGYQRAIGLLA